MFEPPFVKRFALCYRSIVCLSVCDVDVSWLNGWMDRDETWHGVRSRSTYHMADGTMVNSSHYFWRDEL